MAAEALHAPLDLDAMMSDVADFVHWLRSHRSAVVVAGLLAFAYPLSSLASALGVVPELSPHLLGSGIFRTLSQGFTNWPGFLLAGYILQRLRLTGWRAVIAAFALGACPATGFGMFIYFSSWTDMLAATGHARDFAVDSVANTFSMALLFFTHLQHSRAHEEAIERMAAAKLAQFEARRRLAYGQLQAVQARIDPQFLFDMLEAVRRAYESDPARAEQLLDELVAFLRAALPRLQVVSSNVPREAETARALARLHALSANSAGGMTLELSDDVMGARFPPGVLLPLLDEALQIRAGACALTATRRGASCLLVLTLPAPPSEATVERVRAVLGDLYGSSAELLLDPTVGAVRATVKVPYEHA